jgi:hypothetical protein
VRAHFAHQRILFSRFGSIGALRRAGERDEVRVLRPSRLETIGWQADEKED